MGETIIPAAYAIASHEKLKYVHVSGKTHLNELRRLAESYLDGPEFRFDIRFLVDLTDLEDAQARFRDVFALRNFYKRHLGKLEQPIDVAIVAPTDLGYGISRMFAALMHGGKTMRVRIFPDMSEALTWLDLDDLDISALKHQVSQVQPRLAQ